MTSAALYILSLSGSAALILITSVECIDTTTMPQLGVNARLLDCRRRIPHGETVRNDGLVRLLGTHGGVRFIPNSLTVRNPATTVLNFWTKPKPRKIYGFTLDTLMPINSMMDLKIKIADN